MQVEVKLKKLLHINDAKGFVLEIFVNSVCIRKYIAYYFTEKTVSENFGLKVKFNIGIC